MKKENLAYMELTLDLPISVNHLYVNAYIKGRRMKILSPKAKAWVKENKPKIFESIEKYGWTVKSEKVILDIWFYYPDKRTRDTNNYYKLLLDTMTECGVFIDDKWALERAMDWEIDRERPRIDIILYLKGDEEKWKS